MNSIILELGEYKLKRIDRIDQTSDKPGFVIVEDKLDKTLFISATYNIKARYKSAIAGAVGKEFSKRYTGPVSENFNLYGITLREMGVSTSRPIAAKYKLQVLAGVKLIHGDHTDVNNDPYSVFLIDHKPTGYYQISCRKNNNAAPTLVSVVSSLNRYRQATHAVSNLVLREFVTRFGPFKSAKEFEIKILSDSCHGNEQALEFARHKVKELGTRKLLTAKLVPNVSWHSDLLTK